MNTVPNFGRLILYHSRHVYNNNNNNNNNIFNCKWAVARWQWLTCKCTNMKYGYKKFKSERLHEKHAVTTWSLGNNLSIRL